MSEPYEEILSGEVWLRLPPGHRHELICRRLHRLVADAMAGCPALHLLEPRSVVEVRTGTLVRPDLSLVQAGTGRLWLAAEVISASDHRPDTVIKKTVYDEVGLPRLWVVDPRCDNVEIYSSGNFGLVLTSILAGAETLTEARLPSLSVSMTSLFASDAGA